MVTSLLLDLLKIYSMQAQPAAEPQPNPLHDQIQRKLYQQSIFNLIGKLLTLKVQTRLEATQYHQVPRSDDPQHHHFKDAAFKAVGGQITSEDFALVDLVGTYLNKEPNFGRFLSMQNYVASGVGIEFMYTGIDRMIERLAMLANELVPNEVNFG